MFGNRLENKELKLVSQLGQLRLDYYIQLRFGVFGFNFFLHTEHRGIQNYFTS